MIPLNQLLDAMKKIGFSTPNPARILFITPEFGDNNITNILPTTTQEKNVVYM